MKSTLGRMIFSIGTITLLGFGSFRLVEATDTPTSPGASTEYTQNGMPTQNSTYLINSRRIDAQGDNYLLKNAIRLVNWIMSMLSVVALVILLIGGFKMITANGDDGKFKKGLTILKQAAIGLVIIGLSWAIIRLIFRFINRTDTEGGADYNQNSTAG